VVKVHDGQSGWGTKIVPGDQATQLSQPGWLAMLNDLAQQDGIWSSGPYIVETLIDTGGHASSGFPFAEGTVSDAGFCLDYVCDQNISENGEFKGIILGPDAVPTDLLVRMKKITTIVGEHFYLLGFRGVFDIDFIVDDNERLYVLECNARITGGTHVFELARHLFGSAWLDQWFISAEDVAISSGLATVDEALDTLKLLLFDRAINTCGVILTSFSVSTKLCGLVSVGSTKAYAAEKLRDAIALLGAVP
jgi:hypothetical protein